MPTPFLRAAWFHYEACELSPVALSRPIIDSDVNPGDWQLADPDEICRTILEHPSLGPGSIIHLHDGSESDDDVARVSRPVPMIAALPEIIVGLRDRGLEPVGLDEMDLSQPLTWHGARDPEEAKMRAQARNGRA